MNSNHDSNDDANHGANGDASQNCAAFADELTHLVLGELEPARAAAVEAHCASCATCRAERELLAKSAALIEADAPKLATVMRLSEAREQALLAQAAAAGGLKRKFWTLERLTAAAAAILAVCVTGNWLWRKYDVAPGRPEAEGKYTQVAKNDASRSGAASGPNGPGSSTADAHGADGQVRDSNRRRELATLSAEVARKEQEEAALVEGEEAPATDTLDDLSTVALERMSEPLVQKIESEDAAKSAESLHLIDGVELDDGERHRGTAPEPKADLKKVAGRTGARRAMGGKAQTPPAADGSGKTPLTDADRAALRALGYTELEDDDKSMARRRNERKSPEEEREVLSKQRNGEELTADEVEELKEARRMVRGGGGGGELAELGYAAGSDDEADAVIDAWNLGTTYDFPDVVIMQEAPAGALAVAFHTPREVAVLEEQLRRAAAAGRTVDVDALVKSFLDRLAPRQGEAPRDMFFRWFGDNPAIPTRIDARSTFGMDVDTASYNLSRGYLAKGTLPPKAAVRTEEFVNAFKQGLAAPAAAVDGVQNPDVFALTTELAPSPFGEGKHLLRVGLKAREIDRSARQPATLTFVIDVSGSMEEGGRLELVKQALRLLVAQLDERDSIAIAVFSDNARIALPPTRASDQAKILAALDPLRPEQSTNAGAGLRLGYDLAMTQRDRAGDHRVILCSDGVANAGVTNPDQLTERIRQCKSERIYLTSVGVGMNNVNDALLEQLAREGDGNCHYVDGLAEAKELFVDKLTGTLSTVARDAKIQVEFAPESVRAFRQLGYENRALAHADFRNDKVDAGEVGAGHEVVALYELDLAPEAAGPIATVHCRYEEPRSQTVREQARVCFAADTAPTVAAASPRWRLDAAVAEFAELLRQSVHARDGSFGAIERLAEPLVAELADDKDVPEFVALVKQAARLPDLLPRRGELSRCVDELKKVRCWQQEFGQSDPAQQQANGDLMRQLEEQNRRLEQALRDALANAAGKR